jgi:hypothetical protein
MDEFGDESMCKVTSIKTTQKSADQLMTAFELEKALQRMNRQDILRLAGRGIIPTAGEMKLSGRSIPLFRLSETRQALGINDKQQPREAMARFLPQR